MSTFKKPSESQRKSLAKAQKAYAKDLSLAAGFLDGRGIDQATAITWGLGVVASPMPGHEMAAGRLAIPYCDKLGVVGLQFRCMADHSHKEHNCPKYLFPAGQVTTLFNAPALDTRERTIHITEGALDAVVLGAALAVPVVGVASADSWQPHWPAHFTGFDRAVLWQDGDPAGAKMANRWRKTVGVDVVVMPEGEDVGSWFTAKGAEGLRELLEG